MNSKKSLITIVIIIVVLIAGALLWKGGFSWLGVGIAPSTSPTEGITPATQPGVEGQAGEQAEAGSIGKMTDEIYTEIMAQTTYHLQKYAQDLPSFASHMKVIYAKHGVTAADVEAYSKTLEGDAHAYQAVMQRYTQRLQELQKTGK